MYHEKQSLSRCAVHAMNNLLQEPRFTAGDFDFICNSLSPSTGVFSVNPHKSMWGTGNYDINVITAAAASAGYEVTWHDRRKSCSTLPLDSLLGVLLNVPTPSFWGGLTKSRHWFSLRKIDGKWYNLDSTLKGPQGVEDVAGFLDAHLAKDSSTQLLIVAENKS
jgi:josephin